MVSIVINNYNYGRFLRQSINSALSQTYPRTEVIVVDDGSTDDSREIIASYGERIVPVLKENGGQASAFNAGFTVSRGEVLIFLDADDLLLSEVAEKVIEVWRPGLAKVQYLLEIIDDTGRRQGISIPSGSMPSGDLRNLILSIGAYVSSPTSGNAFACHVLEQLLPMPEREWRISADGYLLHLSPFFGEVVSLSKVLGFYRVHHSNNYTMGELDLRKLRGILAHDMQKQEALCQFGERRGIRVNEDLVLRIPSHVKVRIASLRIDPARHPYPEDGAWFLMKQGVRACWQVPDFSLLKRVFFSAWFVLVSLLPKPVARPLITFGLMPQRRWPFLQAVSK